MELYMGCCHIESRPRIAFSNKELAEEYSKQMNESEEGKDFVKRYSWDDIKYKSFVDEMEIFNF